MKAHELAELFPELTKSELEGLALNIKTNGQQEEIVLLDGQILDGRNRFAACSLAEIKPRTRQFGDRKEDGQDPLAFVLSHNLHRRHLNDSQRAQIAAKIAHKSEPGRPHENGSEKAPTQAEAAKMLNVKPSAVRRAATVEKKAPKAIKEKVRAGKLSLTKASRLVQNPKKGEKAKPKVQRETPANKMLTALDAWWIDSRKQLSAPPMATPEAMMKHFAKLIIKTLGK